MMDSAYCAISRSFVLPKLESPLIVINWPLIDSVTMNDRE